MPFCWLCQIRLCFCRVRWNCHLLNSISLLLRSFSSGCEAISCSTPVLMPSDQCVCVCVCVVSFNRVNVTTSQSVLASPLCDAMVVDGLSWAQRSTYLNPISWAICRFTASRRKYTINFHQLIQFNEESGNRRPIMATYVKDTSKADAESKSKIEPTETGACHTLILLAKNKSTRCVTWSCIFVCVVFDLIACMATKI